MIFGLAARRLAERQREKVVHDDSESVSPARAVNQCVCEVVTNIDASVYGIAIPAEGKDKTDTVRVSSNVSRQKKKSQGQTVSKTQVTAAVDPINTVTLEQLGVHYVYIRKLEDVLPAITSILSVNNTLGLDIETFKLPKFLEDKQAGLEPRKSGIRLVQIYDGATCVYVFDILKLGGIFCLGIDIWKKPMVAHNALFEMKHLIHAGVIPQRLGCSLLADRIINGVRRDLRNDLGLSSSAGLQDLTKEVLNLIVSKDMQKSNWAEAELSNEQLNYAALDSILVFKIFAIQQEKLKKGEMIQAYWIQREAQQAVATMELTGISFDVSKHREKISSWKTEAETLHETIVETVGQKLNLNSGKQIGSWLKAALKEEDLESWAKTDKGQLSTSTHTFKLHEHMHDIFPKIIQYRHVSKRISSFGDGLYKFIDVLENRLYGSFTLGATNTGRMTSRNPNMQQMPRDGFRSLFVAATGYQLVRLDYSQQELRVAALVTEDPALLEIYATGGDVHTETAASLLKISKEQVTKDQRQLAKAVIFGLLYGQGAKGLAVYAKRQYGVEMSVEEAETHRKGLFKAYKGLLGWQRRTGDTTRITQIVKTPCGRVRDFSRERFGYKYCAALNHPIQGAAAEITIKALSRLTPLLCDDCRLVNVVHDEILLEVCENKVNEYRELARVAMEDAFVDIFPNAKPYLKNSVEVGIGKNWEEAH